MAVQQQQRLNTNPFSSNPFGQPSPADASNPFREYLPSLGLFHGKIRVLSVLFLDLNGLSFAGSSPFSQDQPPPPQPQPQPFQSLPPVMYGDGGGHFAPQQLPQPPPGVASNNNSSSSSSTLTEVTPAASSSSAGKKQNNWNPFEDSQAFSQMSADALFGAEFDRIRQQRDNNRQPVNSQQLQQQQAARAEAAPKPRADPFQSAPFLHLP